MSDIRASLPVVIKSGTTHKPVWTGADGQRLRFLQPTNKAGVGPDGKRPRLRNGRLLGQYKAGVTVKGADLMFVGVFGVVRDRARVAPSEGAAEAAAS